MAAAEDFRGLTVADVMLRDPKTLPGTATVGDVRSMLVNPSVQMVLLADGREFCGAISELPKDASDDEQAVTYADGRPDSLSSSEPAPVAFELAAKNAHRRVVVLDDDGLVGLVCLDASRTRFCGGARYRPPASA